MSSPTFLTTQLPPLSNTTTARSSANHHRPSPEKLAILLDKSKSLTQIQQIHAILYRHNLHQNPILNFKLQRSYSSLHHLTHSLTLFNQTLNPNVFFYTSIIHAHALHNLHHQAFVFYQEMLTQNVSPNAFTFSSILKSCPLEFAVLIHSHAVKFGFDSDLYVRTCLVDVYARGGDFISARKLFDNMPERSLVSSTAMITCYARHGMLKEARGLFDGLDERDLVCWNVMIDGYVQHGLANKGLVLFREMLKAKIKPNEVTVLAVLSGCGQIGALESGKWVHSYVQNNEIEINNHVGSALIDMYSKCGSLEDARLVFERIKHKDVVIWNSMISGYATHGFTRDALQLFDEMCKLGYRPTDITFIGILSACGHSGLVNEGWELFRLMKKEYGIEPKIEHYGCMVNLLGRAGQLKEAYELVKKMEIDPDPILWGTLLGACRLHGNLTLGEEIAEFLISQNLANSGTYVLLSNIYAATGNWENVAKMRTLLKDSGIEKEPGCSSIEVGNNVHEFLAGDLRHRKSKEIYMMLEEIDSWLKAQGYKPHTDLVLHDLADAQKEQNLKVHSEKLAIAYGLISTKPGTPIKIVKNLRVCADCHAVTKLISKITRRKIVMRDRNRFHHFVDGSCSCQDYW
ncbi:pentatricopeptide repeat-containing protein ELI1, chloroplastic [Mercurialis annua]|uniref:pentatricopeptide repeat-containing protein ELI1, chloroplastic n=1 Tax=Mercurialis annua TaxID=3986 RepID=UPI00215F1E95|nr:pentatricopeptide repeat-containing protein ELI1, chloroplastic [Mercurialis annua]